MAPFVSLLRTTRDNAREHGRTFAGRTRTAGATFATETKEAGSDLVRFVRFEAKRWRRYVRARTAKVSLQLFAPRTVEREILARVDGTLRKLDGRVVQRLDSLAARPRGSRPKRSAKRKAPPTTRPSGTTLIAGGRKNAG